MTKLEFTIHCIPPKHTAQGSSTILKNFKTGKFFIGKKSNSKAIQAKTDLMALLLPYQPKTPLQGALECEIEVVYPWRNSEPKKNRATGYRWCDKKPDIDNWLKQYFDCLTRLNFWNDDAQVSDLHFSKRWGNEPRITTIISEIYQ